MTLNGPFYVELFDKVARGNKTKRSCSPSEVYMEHLSTPAEIARIVSRMLNY